MDQNTNDWLVNEIKFTDTKSLSDFIVHERHELRGIAEQEWIRRNGKPYPYHSSFPDNIYS